MRLLSPRRSDGRNSQHKVQPVLVLRKSTVITMKSVAYKRDGGGGRTRTYEGLASGFTVRPLCRSGHSPMPQDQVSRTKTPRAGRGGCGKAYVASRLGLSTGNMTLIERRDGRASVLWRAALRSAHLIERALFRQLTWVNRRLVTLRSPPRAQCAPTRAKLRTRAADDQYGAPSLCTIRRFPSTVTTARSSSGYSTASPAVRSPISR